ncbi:hypothetical protein [Streptantibioticus silvisoli]|uniref:Uncharacterized protein n=1 Tax=Streptantibioticus silvisoli TaxID=2705255 RepID=A0ABT6WAW1_9ACTN|nr:hypothetical protein [Streptantibioticus silvisoli]MDI5967619.1 hypothetical protein [Streptantibioticus silvisoli]
MAEEGMAEAELAEVGMAEAGTAVLETAPDVGASAPEGPAPVRLMPQGGRG